MGQNIDLSEQLKELSEESEPKWESMKTTEQENNINRLKIKAQGCNPQTPSC